MSCPDAEHLGSGSENLSALADCVGYVPPRWHMMEGYLSSRTWRTRKEGGKLAP